jgi:hypothetical protein
MERAHFVNALQTPSKMNIAKKTVAAMGAFTLSATLVHGQGRLFFQDVKNFRQISPDQSEYLGGAFNVTMVDGSFTILGCAFNGGDVFSPPNQFCPAGTTALIDSGDIDGDGLRDGGTYWSVGQIIPAIQVEPFLPQLVELYAAPPSALPRPLGGFNWRDDSLVLYFDLVNDPSRLGGYEITRYLSSRGYGASELQRHRDEIVPGTYTFKFPALYSTEENPRNFFVQIGHREMIEAYPGPGGLTVTQEGISVGNDFRISNDEVWRGDVMEIDPRVGYRLEWEGFNTSTFLGNDEVFFSVVDRQSGTMIYPPYPPGNATYPQLIGSAELGIPTYFEMGPAFFDVGEQVVAEILFERASPFGNATDVSSRSFTFDIDFVDTYAGFVLQGFPAGTLDELLLPEADADGDGHSNLEEFALMTDPSDPASVPNMVPVLLGIAGFEQCVLDVPKRPAAGSGMIYEVQYSTDLETWTTITEDDPNWYIETDSDALLRVRSILPYGQGACLTRVRITQDY